MRHHLEQIMKAGQRARRVVDQILTFSRRGDRRHRPIVAQTATSEAIELLRASLPATLSLRTMLRAPDARIHGDATQLEQVVMNLSTNAAHAMDGHGTIEIALDTIKAKADLLLSHGNLPAGRYVRVSVSDTGCGMDAPTMRRIFEPFFTTKAAGSGTGLGLATVHGIVAEHHGAINVKSAPGAGTIFEAYFPQTEAREGGEQGTGSMLPRGEGQTILLVDDERDLVLLGEEMLASLGFEPVGFDNGSAALGAFRADPHRFDLVLTDEVMPAMTGTELASAMHRLCPDLPIVLMTGYAGPVPIDRIRDSGIREVVRKPLLSATIAHCLARHLH
jgi:CheY-like chemotaxis protein/anti-sigma regulatory factor (Ser/Thr protein kinase)